MSFAHNQRLLRLNEWMNEWKHGGRRISYLLPSPPWTLPLPDLLQWTLLLPHLCVTNNNSVRMGQLLQGAAQRGTRLETALIQILQHPAESTGHAGTSLAQEVMGLSNPSCTEAGFLLLQPSLSFHPPLPPRERGSKAFCSSSSSGIYYLICL